MNKTIKIYTDGGASGNPGPGGLGVVMMAGKLKKEISIGYKLTTNNRMELLAVITALAAIKWENAKAIIYTDSKYVSEAVNQGWLFQWEQKDFKKKKNPDLWLRFLELYRKHNVELKWVKGHANIPGNERADRLAVEAYQNGNLLVDEGYENSL